jgi:hypothetical protein
MFEIDGVNWCSNVLHIKILIQFDYNMYNLTIHKYFLKSH